MEKSIRKKFPIYNRYLRIKNSKPLSIVLAFIMSFLQAMLGAMLQIWIIEYDYGMITLGSMTYWIMFALNGKRVALGGWKAISSFIIAATAGTVFGVYLLSIII